MWLDQSTTAVATIEEPTNRTVRYCPKWCGSGFGTFRSDPIRMDLLSWMTWKVGSGSEYGQILKFGTSRPDRIRNDLKGRIRIRNKLFRTHKTAPDAEKLLPCYLRWAWKKYQASLLKNSKNCKGNIVSKAGLKPFFKKFSLIEKSKNFQKTFLQHNTRQKIAGLVWRTTW